MGSSKSKVRMPDASINVTFEEQKRCYDAEHPIIGSIEVQVPQEIGAYGI